MAAAISESRSVQGKGHLHTCIAVRKDNLRRSSLRKDHPETTIKILVNPKISSIVRKLGKSVRWLGKSVRKVERSVRKLENSVRKLGKTIRGKRQPTWTWFNNKAWLITKNLGKMHKKTTKIKLLRKIRKLSTSKKKEKVIFANV